SAGDTPDEQQAAAGPHEAARPERWFPCIAAGCSRMCGRRSHSLGELISDIAADRRLLLELKCRPAIPDNAWLATNAKLCSRHWRFLLSDHSSDGASAEAKDCSRSSGGLQIRNESCALCGKQYRVTGVTQCSQHCGRLSSDPQLFRVTCALLTEESASLISWADPPEAEAQVLLPFACRACFLTESRRLAASRCASSAKPRSLPHGLCRSMGSTADCVTVCGCRMALRDLAPWQVSKTAQRGQVVLCLAVQDTSRCLILDSSSTTTSNSDGVRSYTAQCGDQILETGRLPADRHACLALTSLLDRLRRLSPCPGLFAGQLQETVAFLAQLPASLLPRLQVSLDADRGCLQVVRSRRCHGVLERRPPADSSTAAGEAVGVTETAASAAVSGAPVSCCADCRGAVQFAAYPDEAAAADAAVAAAGVSSIGPFDEKALLFEQHQLY
ncbi:hypothetical protein BOX15_Mlig029962g5, partial [Macrostomum lignano]